METAYWNDYYLKRKGKSSNESKDQSAARESFHSGNEIYRKLKKKHQYLLSKEPSFRTFRIQIPTRYTSQTRGYILMKFCIIIDTDKI